MYHRYDARMRQDHNRILTTAARASLPRLGFWQKGRSRVWLADRGFWLSVVEFQPSGFGKGSYLNVAAHWLWSHTPNSLSFDYTIMSGKPWIPFENVAQFETGVAELVERAVEESKALKSKIIDVQAVASLLVEHHDTYDSAGCAGGWPAFNAAVAAGVVGDMANARSLFDKANESIGAWRADMQALIIPYGDALRDAATFETFITQRINANRTAWGLDPWLT